MPNLCDYAVKVVGTHEHVDRFVKYLNNGYLYSNTSFEYGSPDFPPYDLKFQDDGHYLYTNANKHFYRVFDCYIDEEDYQNEELDEYYAICSGDCAWSVYSCMFDGFGTYHKSGLQDEFANLRRKHATTIPEVSKDLNLKIEIYSCECGMCFAEHYLVENGEIIKEEEFNYEEFSDEDYPERSDMEKVCERTISDDEWEHNDYFWKCDINVAEPEWSI